MPLIGQNSLIQDQKNGVMITIDKQSIYYALEVRKGSDIHDLASITKVAASELIALNKKKVKNNQITTSTLIVPYKADNIKIKPQASLQSIEIRYEIKRGETFYSIVKNKLGLNIDEIKKINKIQDNNLQNGQKLLLGYLYMGTLSHEKQIVNRSKQKEAQKAAGAISGKKKENEKITEIKKVEAKTEKASPKEEIAAPPSPKIITVTKPSLAMWDRESKVTDNLYVLHNQAEIGSIVEISYPMMHRKTKAKVLGRIPDGTYQSDVTLFISPGVARQLGMLDSKSRVMITYQEASQ
jgi:hypothetical protein